MSFKDVAGSLTEWEKEQGRQLAFGENRELLRACQEITCNRVFEDPWANVPEKECRFAVAAIAVFTKERVKELTAKEKAVAGAIMPSVLELVLLSYGGCYVAKEIKDLDVVFVEDVAFELFLGIDAVYHHALQAFESRSRNDSVEHWEIMRRRCLDFQYAVRKLRGGGLSETW